MKISPNLWQHSPGQQLLKSFCGPLHNGLSLWFVGYASGMSNLLGPWKVIDLLREIVRINHTNT